MIVKVLSLACVLGVSIAAVTDTGGAYSVTQKDGSLVCVPKAEGNSDYADIKIWLASGNKLSSPAPTPGPMYDVQYAIQLQQKLLAVSAEISQNTSAPAAVAVLRDNITKELSRIRSLPAAPVTTKP